MIGSIAGIAADAACQCADYRFAWRHASDVDFTPPAYRHAPAIPAADGGGTGIACIRYGWPSTFCLLCRLLAAR